MDKTALFCLSYGLYILSAKEGEKDAACVINTCAQVTSEPARVSVTVNKQNHTHDVLARGGVGAVSVLTGDVPMALIQSFGFRSSRDNDKLAGVAFARDGAGCAYLTRFSAAYLSLKVERAVDLGSHTMFVCLLTDAGKVEDKPVLTYEEYHRVKKGGAPKTAPTYQAPEKQEAPARKAARYVCQICGYVYDPEAGAPEAGIAPGTAWEDLPADFECPVCGVDKSNFEPES